MDQAGYALRRRLVIVLGTSVRRGVDDPDEDSWRWSWVSFSESISTGDIRSVSWGTVGNNEERTVRIIVILLIIVSPANDVWGTWFIGKGAPRATAIVTLGVVFGVKLEGERRSDVDIAI